MGDAGPGGITPSGAGPSPGCGHVGSKPSPPQLPQQQQQQGQQREHHRRGDQDELREERSVPTRVCGETERAPSVPGAARDHARLGPPPRKASLCQGWRRQIRGKCPGSRAGVSSWTHTWPTPREAGDTQPPPPDTSLCRPWGHPGVTWAVIHPSIYLSIHPSSIHHLSIYLSYIYRVFYLHICTYISPRTSINAACHCC